MTTIDLSTLAKLELCNNPVEPCKLETIAKVVDCYDGDTCTIVYFTAHDNCTPIKLRLRLYGIDTPERRGKSEKERTLALQAKKFLENAVLNKCVYIKLFKWDKWGGRVLGELYQLQENKIVEPSVNQQLVDAKLAVQYDGRRKTMDWSTF
jgi:micrococcal nuclease